MDDEDLLARCALLQRDLQLAQVELRAFRRELDLLERRLDRLEHNRPPWLVDARGRWLTERKP
jgi:hypothetical protein